MSILIKGMKMPKYCDICDFYHGDTYGICDVGNHIILWEGKYPHCPLIELPPHGKLIDADELLNIMFKLVDEETFMAFRQIINDAPAIIEAEEGE